MSCSLLQYTIVRIHRFIKKKKTIFFIVNTMYNIIYKQKVQKAHKMRFYMFVYIAVTRYYALLYYTGRNRLISNLYARKPSGNI